MYSIYFQYKDTHNYDVYIVFLLIICYNKMRATFQANRRIKLK